MEYKIEKIVFKDIDNITSIKLNSKDGIVYSNSYIPSNLNKDPDFSIQSFENSLHEPEIYDLNYDSLEKDTETGLYFSPNTESVIGIDERKRINNTDEWPYCTMGNLILNFPKGSGIGTGTMITDRHVLTAGHCLYQKKYGGWVKSIIYIPALNNSTQPFGSSNAIKIFAPNGFVEKEHPNYDFGVLELETNIGNKTGWLGIGSIKKEIINNLPIFISGYPGDKGGKQLWGHSDAVTKSNSFKFAYKNDTMGGQSGSSIISDIINPDELITIGIHTSGHFNNNYGTRINMDVLKFIQEVILNN